MIKDQLSGFIRHCPKGVTWREIRQEHQFRHYPTSTLLDILSELTRDGKIEQIDSIYEYKKPSALFH